VSKANNVVGDVHGGVTGLIYEDALIESSEHLEGEETDSEKDAGWISTNRSGG